MPGIPASNNQMPLFVLGRGEGYAKEARRFNVILTGAVFMEHAQLFSRVMADELAPLRALVDELMNGEDLLMNFVVANRTRGSHLPYAEVRIKSSLQSSLCSCMVQAPMMPWCLTLHYLNKVRPVCSRWPSTWPMLHSRLMLDSTVRCLHAYAC